MPDIWDYIVVEHVAVTPLGNFTLIPDEHGYWYGKVWSGGNLKHAEMALEEFREDYPSKEFSLYKRI